MNKKTKIIIGAVLAAVLMACIWFFTKPKTETGTKTAVLEIVDSEGKSVTYELKTDAEYLHQFMDEVAEKNDDFTFDGSDSEYGYFLTTVNGETPDYSVDQSYWAIYVNDEYGNYGVDEQPVADGDVFKIIYERYQE